MRALLAAMVAALVLVPAAAAGAGSIAAENVLPGDSGWQGRAAAENAIQGYATESSAAAGETIHLHVSTYPGARYRIELYRLGWYGGAGGRRVACVPSCSGDERGSPRGRPTGDGTSTPIRADWPVTDAITVQPDWPSGYYLVRFVLTADGPPRAATTFVIVREAEPDQPSAILVEVPVNTWQAYNAWGGRSLYNFTSERGVRVSFQRPYGQQAQSPLWYEIQLVRFLEREGYDVSYQTDADTSFHPDSLLRHRLVIVAGHDEYWTKEMRDGFEAARDAGTNLAFMGSNDAYWQMRYEDGGQTIYAAKSIYDPQPQLGLKTAMFRELGRPECDLMGVMHDEIPRYTRPLDFAVAAASDSWFAGTGFAAGDKVAGVVGREYDVLSPWGGCDHPGTVVLFHYQGRPGAQNADAVRFTAPSGARVFAAGAQRFAWGLDAWRSSLDAGEPQVPADDRLVRFMRNALDDLTRPAPPSNVSVSLDGNTIVVSVDRSADPRTVGFVATAWTGRRWVNVCRGVTSCSRTPRRRQVPPNLQVSLVALDRWGASSAAVTAVVR